jgi:N-glycosylase/DNA lyase
LKDGVSVVVAIQETATTTLYRPLTTQVSADDLFLALKEYFRLQHSLAKISQTWSSSDSRLATIADCIPGVRIVEQDPFECLISFICSSNNNIPRITKMVNAIRANYGDELLSIGEETFYSFPSLEQFISKANDDDLKSKCGLGYRSKYILETLPLLQEKGGEAYLADLREINDPIIVQDKLIEFCGVGRKVADCVALFSLRQDDAIPVDVHVWNIARRDYDPDNALATVKSLTPTTYRQVGDLFRSRFTQKAGWAHSLLFVAELPSFRPVLPKGLVEEMDFFKENEKLKKKEAVAAKKKRKQDECREKLVL